MENFFDVWMVFIDGSQMAPVRKHFGQDIPDFYEISKERSALSLVNSHFITHGIWPTYPNSVDIGGEV